MPQMLLSMVMHKALTATVTHYAMSHDVLPPMAIPIKCHDAQ